jgi:hypothetical protein
MVATSIVAFSFINIVLLGMVQEPSLAKLVGRTIRFFLTFGLAYFLLRGASWARWIAIVTSIFSVLSLVIGMATLPRELPFYFHIWALLAGVFYAAVAGVLIFNSSAISHFSRRASDPLPKSTTNASGNA